MNLGEKLVFVIVGYFKTLDVSKPYRVDDKMINELKKMWHTCSKQEL
jgi:hypothetical protein